MRRRIGTLVLVLALVGCTSTPEDRPSTTLPPLVPATTTATTSTTASTSTSASASSSTASATTSSPHSATTPSAQESPLGTSVTDDPDTSSTSSDTADSTLSQQEQAWADEAWSRFEDYRTAVDHAEADPLSPTWRAEVEAVSTGPALIEVVESVETLASVGFRGAGAFEFAFLSVESSSNLDVVFVTCMDSNNAVLVDSNGEVVQDSVGVKSEFRVRVNRHSEATPWLVVESDPQTPEASC